MYELLAQITLRETSMRRTLLSIAAIAGILVATACADVTAPKSETRCPISGGSQVCDIGH